MGEGRNRGRKKGGEGIYIYIHTKNQKTPKLFIPGGMLGDQLDAELILNNIEKWVEFSGI